MGPLCSVVDVTEFANASYLATSCCWVMLITLTHSVPRRTIPRYIVLKVWSSVLAQDKLKQRVATTTDPRNGGGAPESCLLQFSGMCSTADTCSA